MLVHRNIRVAKKGDDGKIYSFSYEPGECCQDLIIPNVKEVLRSKGYLVTLTARLTPAMNFSHSGNWFSFSVRNDIIPLEYDHGRSQMSDVIRSMLTGTELVSLRLNATPEAGNGNRVYVNFFYQPFTHHQGRESKSCYGLYVCNPTIERISKAADELNTLSEFTHDNSDTIRNAAHLVYVADLMMGANTKADKFSQERGCNHLDMSGIIIKGKAREVYAEADKIITTLRQRMPQTDILKYCSLSN